MTAEAFRGAQHSAPPTEPGGDPGEVALVEQLRADPSWIPELSLVAVIDDHIVGHVVGSRARVGDDSPAIGLGPLSVAPEHQHSGIGSALMAAVLNAAQARGETVVGLLGEPAYYRRFGFVPATSLGIGAPDAEWGDYFQARRLTSGQATGTFHYAAPFGAG